jgi:hypothetical protein
VVLPNYSWWERKNYKDAVRLPENFVYTSDNNDHWLTIDDMRTIVCEPAETVFIDRRGLAVVNH